MWRKNINIFIFFKDFFYCILILFQFYLSFILINIDWDILIEIFWLISSWKYNTKKLGQISTVIETKEDYFNWTIEIIHKLFFVQTQDQKFK